MQRAIGRLDSLLGGRRRLVLVAWLLLLLAAAPFFLRQEENLTAGGYTVPGSGSERVEEASRQFPGAQPNRLLAVIRLAPGAEEEEAARAIAPLIAAVPGLDPAEPPPDRTKPAGSEDARILVLPIDAPTDQDSAIDAAVDLRDEIDERFPERLGEAFLAGQPALWAGLQKRSQEDLVAAEAVGFPIVFLILLVTFGSLAAAALPLGLGFASVALTGAVIHLLSRELEMSVFVTNIASLIGIGVAVDYSLFVLSRYRQERAAGANATDARRTAMRTSGVAVVYSGTTVVIALAGLFLIDSPTLRSMALGAIVVVSFAVLAAVALLPALITLLGDRALRPGRLSRALTAARARLGVRRSKEERWERWVARVQRRPLVAAVLATLAMAALAIPAFSIETGVGALRQLDRDDPERVGTELAARALGPGALGPLEVLVERSSPAELAEYAASLRGDPAVAEVEEPDNAGLLGDIITVIPRADPESDDALALLERIRDGAHRPPGIAAEDVAVGGATAQNEDFRALVFGSLWKVMLFVAAISYVVLFLLLRSVILPLKAVLVNLLSVGAAYGVVVAVFQWGILDGLTGFDSAGYVNDITPAFILPIVFGLSMDYEVFLLSRIRERQEATGDTRTAVAQGLAASAGTITAAALVMCSVFLTFVAVSVPSVKELGLGLAVAIALDATIVRLVLVPAVMTLLGRWNWWVPRRLAREPA